MEKISDIYAGKLNTERIKEYRELSKLYNISEGTVRAIFCHGAEWYRNLVHRNQVLRGFSAIDMDGGRMHAGTTKAWIKYADELWVELEKQRLELKAQEQELDDLKTLLDEFPIQEGDDRLKREHKMMKMLLDGYPTKELARWTEGMNEFYKQTIKP